MIDRQTWARFVVELLGGPPDVLTILLFAAAQAATSLPKPIGTSVFLTDRDMAKIAPDRREAITLRFTIDVDADGRPTGCNVTKTSGDNGVDHRVCETLLKRAKFKPARNESGEPVEGHYYGGMTATDFH